MQSPSLSIVLPTYNERENVEIFIPQLEKRFGDIPHEILVVDDSSPDGTGKAVLELSKKFPNLRLVSRSEKNGIGSALRYGYDAAQNDIILSCDADLSFSPDDLMKLYNKIALEGYDMVIGSRHSASSVYETPRFGVALKYAISRTGNKLLHAMFHLPVHDFSVNCRAMRRETWRSLKTKENTNFFLFEMIYVAQKGGARIGEIPVTFMDRTHGVSKIDHKTEVFKAFWKMVVFLLRRP